MASRSAPGPALRQAPDAVRRIGVASRANVPPFHVMDVLTAAAERRRTHGDLLDLVAGQPSTPAPRPVREAARRALDGVLGYTVATGIPELKEVIADHHRSRHGIDVDAADVVVTTGSSAGFVLAFLSLFDPGQRSRRQNIGQFGLQVAQLGLW